MNPIPTILSVTAILIALVMIVDIVQCNRPSKVAKVTLVDPIPAPPPELSCFVRGLIKSMRETPKEWERNELDFYCALWTHTSTGVWVSYRSNPYHGSLYYSSIYTNASTIAPHEQQPLISAFLIYLENPDKARQEALAKIVEEVAALGMARLAAPFEKLGCPEADNKPSQP